MKTNPSSTGLTIANKGTENPVLLYNGKPFLRTGAVGEVALFAFPWDSDEPVLRDMTHQQWADWQKAHGMGYARAYPESGFSLSCKRGPDADKLYPWKLDHWAYETNPAGEPVVDLTTLDEQYWREFENTLAQCRNNDILVIVQLYQACYFGIHTNSDPTDRKRSWWQMSYFHPANNVNRWPIGERWERGERSAECGNDFMRRCVEDYHANKNTWWKMHRDYVRKILDCIGQKGNVLIDLGNEMGYRQEGFHCYEWVERTIDLVEEWRAETGTGILIGMDEHFWFRVPEKADWVRAHPRLDLLIAHGAADVLHEQDWNFQQNFTPRDSGRLRVQCRKPCVTLHHHDGAGTWPRKDAAFQRMYHWLGMMQKVQALGSYGYGPFIEEDAEKAVFEEDTRFLRQVFDSLHDYAALTMPDHTGAGIQAAPGRTEYQYLLSSDEEALFYTHTGTFDESVAEGARLVLRELELADGEAVARIMRPADRQIATNTLRVEGGSLEIRLPAFREDIAVHLTSSIS